MKQRMIVGLIGLLVFMVSVLVFNDSAQAQFSPGKEMNGGGDTTLEIKQVSPGKATLIVRNIYAVFLDGMSIPDGAQPHLTEADHSGKGTSRVVSTTNPALSKLLFCWRGAGADWEKQKCAPIVNGGADVTIDVGASRSQAFALIPVLVENERARQVVAWGSHPTVRKLFDCRLDSGGSVNDMLTVLTVDSRGSISVASGVEAAKYGQYYTKFCGIGR